jgi:beta-lactamase regulating signal transducer with metallopeptidase domain
MSAIDHLLREPAAQAIGWALLHFIWQGTLLAALTAIALAALRKSAADIRYVVSAISLSLMLTLPAVTAVQLWRAGDSGFRLKAEATRTAAATGTARDFRLKAEATGSERVASGFSRKDSGFSRKDATDSTSVPSSSRTFDSVRIEPWLPMLLLTWICGVAVLSLRLVSGWVWVQRMKSHGTSPVEDGWDVIASRLCRRLHIARTVRLLRSTLVEVPTVIGWLKPVILLPASALSGLHPHQLEAILAHELAHIRRHDYLVNLLQAVVETLLFYHPAVWWLSHRIRTERENCCDDLAVNLCGDPLTYAQALADLEGLRGSTGRFVMAATGASLVQRVRRLLGAPSHAGRAPGWLAGSASVLVLLGIAVGAAGTEALQPPLARAATPAQQATTSPQPETTVTSTQPSVAAQSSTRPARAQVQPRDRAKARAVADVEVEALAAEHVAMLAEQQRTLIALGVQMRVASTWQAVPVLADSGRAIAALNAARIATTPFVARSVARVSAPALAASQRHGTFSWSNNGQKLEIRYDGEVEFTDDDLDVKRLSPGGSLRIRDGGMMTSLLGGHTAEFTADPSGNITRRFWVGSSERPFDPEGRKWLASVLPRFIRQTGIGASARVARIVKAKGAAGVLAEISLIEGSWAKRKYFNELVKTGSLDPAAVRQVLAQAGREIDSDFELASFLIDNSDRLLIDDGSRQAYFDAARSIDSDFEMRRVFSAVVKRGPVSPSTLGMMLGTSRNIESDFEAASLLIDVAKLQSLDSTTRPAFFGALDTVQSDFEHRRVLSALGTRGDLQQETVAAMLTSGASVSSDFEAASFLIQIAKQQPIEGSIRTAFFRAVDSIDSAFERGRVLKAVAQRPDASPETILAVLQAAKGVSSNFEAAHVLLTVAASHPVAGPARDAYIDTAEKLGDFEQGRVLSALVKNERRK